MKEINLKFWSPIKNQAIDYYFDSESKGSVIQTILKNNPLFTPEEIALAISDICLNLGVDPIDYWDSKILKVK